MFGKTEVEQEQQDTGRGKVKLAAVNGSVVAAVVGNRLVVANSSGPGHAPTWATHPLPPGRTMAVGFDRALTEDGWVWMLRKGHWERCYNLAELK